MDLTDGISSPQPPAQMELGQVMEGRMEGGSHRCWNTLRGSSMRFTPMYAHPESVSIHCQMDEKGVNTDMMCQNRVRQFSLVVLSSSTLLSGSETKPKTDLLRKFE